MGAGLQQAFEPRHLSESFAGSSTTAARNMRDVEPNEVFGRIEELADYVKDHRVALITSPAMASRPASQALDECGIPRHRSTSRGSLSDLPAPWKRSRRPVVPVRDTSTAYGLIKRASDLALASMILVVISPLMLAIAIGVKLSSPGPALFKQRRYGLDGREIIVYKFRTMTVLEDGDVIRQATRNDPRVTPFGAFLRRYSLDELPQSNVLQGR